MALFFYLLLFIGSYCVAYPQNGKTLDKPNAQSRQLIVTPVRAQQQFLQNLSPILYNQGSYAPSVQYDFPVIEPQLQYPAYPNLINERQHLIPRPLPQLLIYPGNAGQQFVVHPGTAPGNFLISNAPTDPNLILKETPGHPIIVTGYPRPGHVPAIEKDAEQVPTDPQKVPPPTTKDGKPEKIETLEKSEDIVKSNKETTNSNGVEVFSSVDKTANKPSVAKTANKSPSIPNLKPGQRFFILNGQSLIPAYPAYQTILPNYPPLMNDPRLRYNIQGPINPQLPPSFSIPTHSNNVEQKFLISPNPLIRDNNENRYVPEGFLPQQTGPIEYGPQQVKSPIRTPLLLFQKPVIDGYTNSETVPNFSGDESSSALKANIPILPHHFSTQHPQYTSDIVDDDVVVIDAKLPDDNSATSSTNTEVERVEKSAEPTISQAQPGAVALAGPGGVAAASPRGTAFVGKGGLAVSNPHATAVAGPVREESSTSKKEQIST